MRWMVLILGLLLSGCYANYQGRYQGPPPLQTTSMAQVNTMVGAQQPSAYKVGFMEGCDSGRLSAGDNSFLFKKDTNRFDTDDAYQQGWNDGFNRCVSGEGAPARTSYYQGSYGYDYYYPGTFNLGFYYPSYYYAPGYSLWAGYYGFPRNFYRYRHNHYYTPWYGGNRRHWIAKSRGGGRNFKGRGGNRGWRGGGHKHKGGGRRGGGGGKGRSLWIR